VHEFVTGCQPRVYELLFVGRHSETSFDLRHSTLSAFLYARLGDSGIDQALAHAVHPMTFEQAQPFLDALPKAIVSDLAHALRPRAPMPCMRWFDAVLNNAAGGDRNNWVMLRDRLC
jgi:hypothetical protein